MKNGLGEGRLCPRCTSYDTPSYCDHVRTIFVCPLQNEFTKCYWPPEHANVEKLMKAAATPDPATWQCFQYQMSHDHLSYEGAKQKLKEMDHHRGLPSSDNENIEAIRNLIREG